MGVDILKRKIARAACIAAAFAAPVHAEDEPLSLADSLAHGRFTLELRPRWNRIDESDKPERTEGGTVRAVAGWVSGAWYGWRMTLQAIHADTFAKHFNDNGADFATSPYPLLPDPRYTGANEVRIDYAGDEGMRARLGRQVVRMDNQRWISDNDFRQTPQLFDGGIVAYNGIANTELLGGYFARVRTTSGDLDSLKLTLLHAAWNPAPGHALAAYGYFHDQPVNGAFTGFDNSSYRVAGVRAEGAAARFGAIDIPYVAEFAQQKPYAGGDPRIDASYWRLGAGLGSAGWTLRYDYEAKGSNGGQYGVQMPLTDFYAFNGWTLHFFNTPRTGLRDQWITGRYAIGAFTLYGEAHKFRSDYGSTDFGREADVGLTYVPIEWCTLRLQHARYDPGSGTPDPSIRKTWLTATFTY
jgi:hypothetical protein